MEVEAQRRLPQILVEITDSSLAGEARRAAVQCAKAAGLNESDCGSVAIAVTEMATNIAKHANVGKILCEPVAHNGVSGVRTLSVDKGPGIRDITAAMRDGYSTSGTPGNGLGAVR